jgi:hypothetical protein
MHLDISFWKIVLVLSFAKSLLWEKDGEIMLVHIGVASDVEGKALKLIFLPFSIIIGFASPSKAQPSS